MGCRKLPYYQKYLFREKSFPKLKVVYKNELSEKTTLKGKYQWDLIHNPEAMLFVGLQDESEGELVDDNIIENILNGIRNTVNGNENELKISDYYTTTYSYGVEVSNWKVIDFGEGNKFTVALNIHKVSDEVNKNIIKLLDKTEEINKRKYLSVDGNCLTISFMYKERDNIVGLEIAVPESEAEKFKEFLFGSGIRFEVESNGERINEDSYVTISAEPEMPPIKIINTSTFNVMFRLRIEYRRDIRSDEDYFPTSEWKTVKSGESWIIDFGDKIRGGKVTLLYKTGNKEFNFTFHVRGVNPTEQAIKDYINEQGYDIWFLTRLIRQESNYLHFNSGTNYGPNWDNSQGCPNWGSPHGWGLMQLDLTGGTTNNPLRPTAQELWDWKANLSRGVQFIEGEKYNAVNRHFNSELGLIAEWNLVHQDDKVEGHADQAEGNITYTHSNSQNFDHDFGDDPTGTDHSFLDASWIKHYNGSSRPGSNNGWYYNLERDTRESKPYWVIYNLNVHNHNYVEAVSNRAE